MAHLAVKSNILSTHVPKNEGLAGPNITSAPTLLESHSSFELGFQKVVRSVNVLK
jgi:hypothetical protein